MRIECGFEWGKEHNIYLLKSLFKGFSDKVTQIALFIALLDNLLKAFPSITRLICASDKAH